MALDYENEKSIWRDLYCCYISDDENDADNVFNEKYSKATVEELRCCNIGFILTLIQHGETIGSIEKWVSPKCKPLLEKLKTLFED